MNPVPKKSKYEVTPVVHLQPDPVQGSLPLCNPKPELEVRALSRISRIPKYHVALVREKSILWPSRKFHSSRDVWEFGKTLTETTDREQFWALMLDMKNCLIGVNLVAQGAKVSVSHITSWESGRAK